MVDRTALAAVQDFIRYMVSAIASASLYSFEHQQVRRLGSEALTSLWKALASEEEIVLLLIDEELVCNKTPLDCSLYLSKFIRVFQDKSIEYLKVCPQVELDELLSLVLALSRRENSLEIRSSTNIHLGKLVIERGGQQARDEGAHVLHALSDIFRYEKEILEDLSTCSKQNRKFSLVAINEIVSASIRTFRQAAGPLRFLEPLTTLDDYTFTHSTNVCILNLAQAMSMGIEGRLLHDIGVAALLHDIGKLSVPEEILCKPGKLSCEEREIINQHPVKGAHYLFGIPGVPKLAIVCAFEHHMRYDGTGYPAVSVGWRQNLCSQITAVSDYFDALRTKRSYRGALECATVAAMMVDLAGTALHPVLTRNFLGLLGKDSIASSGTDECRTGTGRLS